MVPISRSGIVLTMALAAGCSQKESECTSVLRPLKNLGKKLAAAQSVSGDENARPEQVAKALRALSKEATSAAEALDGIEFASEELSQVAAEGVTAASSLAAAAEQMARSSEGMKGMEGARNTARIQRTLANVAAANIDRLCASRPADCEGISQILLARPAIPNAVNDSSEAAAWNARTTAWLARLSDVRGSTPELERQLANLAQTSRAYAAALGTLTEGDAPATELARLSRSLRRPIETLGTAMARAEERCKP